MPRMQILSPAEQRAFDTLPRMNAAQRKAAFDLPLGFQKEAEQLRNPIHQIGFCLNAGYFRHGRRCFAPETFHSNDIAYVAGRLGHDAAWHCQIVFFWLPNSNEGSEFLFPPERLPFSS
ncbi:DUF4158 domain-containing protein [Pseudovibrio sp. WM33]|uniref:DUF4158 domain-containing protein n=1 Tax=Pseudovibrio sp. WM33 TaxID=1735585 RepID=UPI00187D51E9|nr:DUF4158 domain-containing protein [Pseudovibrio sp. WM33]